MKLSERWITDRETSIVAGLCKECDRTYGHDDDCRVGELVRLEAENEELKEYAIEQVGIEHVPEKWGGELK